MISLAQKRIEILDVEKRTSSLFVCFCRLVLRLEVPASLCAVAICSRAGRGMPDDDGLLAYWFGLRFLGAPRKVPVVDMMEGWNLNAGPASGQQ